MAPAHADKAAVHQTGVLGNGQTGSGKTFTIYGNEKLPGLTPRGVTELYNVIDRDSGKASFRVSCYMLEVYCDDLADLLSEHTKGSTAYATRVSTIKNDVSKHENSAEVLKLKKTIDYWKEQAGLPPHKRDYVDLEEIADEKPNGPQEWARNLRRRTLLRHAAAGAARSGLQQ